jgi:hypothetical protein
MKNYSFRNDMDANLVSQLLAGEQVNCPCCGRYGQLNEIKINKSMAGALLWLNYAMKNCEDGWVNIRKYAPRWILKSNSYSRPKYWGLMEKAIGAGPYWRLTAKGLQYVNNMLEIPKTLFVYDDWVVAENEEKTKIRDCFESVFEYQVEMRNAQRAANQCFSDELPIYQGTAVPE